MNADIVKQRVADLRNVMKRENLAAFIFPSTDPHNGEYIPEHWKGREWISGFNGSAGIAVVTMSSAALWTDSRYFIAAEEQLKGTDFLLMKDGVEGTLTISEWIGKQLQESSITEVGIDGMSCNTAYIENLIISLRNNGGLTLRTNFDPLKELWSNRPPIPKNKIFLHPYELAGEKTRDKLTRIRKELRKKHADGTLVTTLDDIAWILNLRGNDVHCNPVFVSYLLIEGQKTSLFIDKEKLTPEVSAYLAAEDISIADYNEVVDALKNYSEYNILLDINSVNYRLYKEVDRVVVRDASPIPSIKCVKNAQEVDGFRKAMIRDGVVMIKFLAWLIPAVKKGDQSEMSIEEKLLSFRSQQPMFVGLSFDTISAYEEHGAIVHYEATTATNKQLESKGFLLLDSGAQYKDGTTDITRTIALGEISEEQKKVYTLVLKGHIQLQLLKFPRNASGTQLDALARKDMWREGYNFMHGTGHGVGSFLNVHEGPHQIRQEYKSEPIREYMTVTDEPGIYIPGKFGVRIENTLLTVPYKETDFGKFLQFETLTLCPIDKTPIIKEMLNDEEINWLNNYHKTVFEKTSPYLEPEEIEWLKWACSDL